MYLLFQQEISCLGLEIHKLIYKSKITLKLFFVCLKFENVNYTSDINHADAQTSNTGLKPLNQPLVLLHYYENSPPISKSWILAYKS